MPVKDDSPDARAGWNAGADAWREFVRSGADYYRLDVHGPALLSVCQPVDGAAALDLGCGEGYFARELARRGARVTAVDVSEEQLRAAQEEEARQPLGIRYVHMDARDVAARWPAASFDRVTACMSLQDMADAPGAIAGAAGVLRPGGRFVFSVPHPATDTAFREWERDAAGRKLALRVDRYFDTGPDVMHWSMPRLKYQWFTPHWRRTLQEWSELLGGAGFLIRRLIEPRPTAEQVRANPRLEDCARLPYFLVVDAFVPPSG
jgi:2-polyprenyl-3-methyl-5-hydroxy-6-metoxy-1,4-benzoquinol methylase